MSADQPDRLLSEDRHAPTGAGSALSDDLLGRSSGGSGDGFESTSTKAWSPIPMDLGTLIDREQFALISPIPDPNAHPDAAQYAELWAPTSGGAPAAPMATAASAPTHPSAIQSHLQTGAGFITSERPIGLKLMGRPLNQATAPEPAPPPVATPPSWDAAPAPARPADATQGCTPFAAPSAHQHPSQQAPTTPVASPAPAAAPAHPRATAVSTAEAVRNLALGVHSAAQVHPDTLATLPAPAPADTALRTLPPPAAYGNSASMVGQRLPGEAGETHIVNAPAVGRPQSFFSAQSGDGPATRTIPTPLNALPVATSNFLSTSVFASAPSGPPTELAGDPLRGSQSMAHSLDWRLPTAIVLSLSYLPAIVRALLRVHPTNVLGFGVVAALLFPVVFVVTGARRMRADQSGERPVDLAIGSALVLAALAAAQIIPRLLGPAAWQWHTELISLPLALAAVTVLLWGNRFATVVRSSAATAGLAMPILAAPALLGGTFPFGGATNPVSLVLARLITPVTESTAGRYLVGTGSDERTVDLRPLSDHRSLIIGVAMLAIALLTIGKVNLDRTGGLPITETGRQLRKLTALLLTLMTAVMVDTVLGVVALAGGTFLSPSLINTLTNGAVPYVLYALAGLSVTRWARVCALFIPSPAAIRRAPIRMPVHGPRGRVDQAVVIGSAALLSISALTSGITAQSHLHGATSVAAPQPASFSLPAPEGWTVTDTATPNPLHAYYGSRSTWTRLQLDPGSLAQISQVHVDFIGARRAQLETFSVSSTFDLGPFRPYSARWVDLGRGARGRQETFFDPASSSTWSTVSFLVTSPTAAGLTITEKIVVSGTGAAEAVHAPEPAARALPALLLRPVTPGGADLELMLGRIARTENAIAELAASEAIALRAGVVTPTPLDAVQFG